MSAPEYVYVTVIAAPREKVWHALTTAEFTQQYWHSTRVRSEWKPGSRVVFLVGNDEVGCEGEVLESNYPGFLSYTWRFPGDPETKHEPPSRVSFTLEPFRGGTKLIVRHDHFQPGSRVFEQVSGGWPLVIGGLKTLLETGKAVDFTAAD